MGRMHGVVRSNRECVDTYLDLFLDPKQLLMQISHFAVCS